MNILIIGEEQHLAECSAKFGDAHAYTRASNHQEAEKFLHSGSLVFDFVLEENPAQIEVYSNKKTTAFINTAKISLAEATLGIGTSMAATLFGFNGMPTFVNRPLLEVSLRKQEDKPALENVCKMLAAGFSLVDDRVGLVTPRIICMIINEAYYTVQDGTATREDIDLAMKLGTNYPYGPFEWCQRIGIRHVYELLEAVYNDTKDERYKICALLKKEYLAA
jgi:3-hydroxybutyryl-CoA dehydrogenase